jgi:general secretion pathway protein D
VLPVPGSQSAAPSAQDNASGAQDGGGTSVGFSWNGPAQAKVGDKITLVLNAQSLRNFKKVDFDVGFDPSVLKVLDVSVGDAMKQDNVAASLSKVIDQNDGGITAGVTGRGKGSGGSVIVITLQVLAPAAGTTVTVNSINGTLENGSSESLTAPDTYSVVAE